MPGYSDVCLWVQNDKLSDLKKALAEKELKLEDKLQEKLEDIYCEYVPQAQREQIEERIAAEIRTEQEEAARRAAEQYRESVVKVIFGGQLRCWKITASVSDVQIAGLLRKALRDPAGAAATVFDALLGEKTEIGAAEFACVACMFLRGEKPAANAVMLDFDKEIVTLAKPGDGYLTYQMKDISTAIYRAEQTRGLREEQVAHRFYQRLSGKTVDFVPQSSCELDEAEERA